MADALVSIALEKLIDVVGQQLSLFAGATRELQKLSSTFQSIQEVLADAESRQASDDSVKQWLSRLRHVAYDIEDLLEDGQISGLVDQEGNEDYGNSRNKLCLCFPFGQNRSDYVVSRYRIAHGIKEITERLDQIDVERKRFDFTRSTQGGDDKRPGGSQRLTTSLIDESEMFIGREDDKETIISKLVSGSSHEDGGRVQVVGVVGIGGLGKTTLARQIYNDLSVRNHFNTALYWVCVSETFDVIKLTKDIIEEVTRASTTLTGLNALQNELLNSLRGKRYLLVLDDVWNYDAEKWNLLRLPLNSGAQGCRILVTTRGQKVAKTMNATYIHELQGLSDDDSWEVFRSRAFAERTPEECSKLEKVGRQTVSKCRGVPLAITVMGSVMNTKRTMADWQNILDSKMWSLEDAKNKILPALWLSYYNLPRQLKQCFAYCSMFPKDWVLEKHMLVRLWGAQGFIRSDGNRDIEDVGAGYFDDLVAGSMFQEVETNEDGKITCKMHDLLHDLAESIAKDETYTFIGNSEQCPSANSNVRHSFLFFTDSTFEKFNEIPNALGKATKLRTLFLHCPYHMGNSIVDILHQARFIGTLIFRSFGPRWVWQCNAIVELPKEIGDLKHLRYLDFSGLDIVELPESVSVLRNLHTLNLSNCKKLEKILRDIGGIVSLRHLEIEGTDRLKYLPKKLGRNSGLRSLCKFIVGGGDEGEGCGIDELQRLNSLQGTLEIQHLERVASREEAEKAELRKKQYLCSLDLDMSKGRDDAETGMIDSVLEGLRSHENLEELEIQGYDDVDVDDNDAETERIDSVLEGLRPHENLEELRLRCRGSKLPSWMDERCLCKLVLSGGPILERVPHLPSLRKFEIFSLRNEILPDEGWGRLVALQILDISHCKELKCLPEGLMQLPSLENLQIYGCDNLESLPEGLGQLRKLNSLQVGDSKVMRCLPDSLGQLQSLESLYVRSCRNLESLPDSLGQLKKLNKLHVSGSKVLTCLPESLGQLKSLECLEICSCKKLESLPVSLGQLKKLWSLKVSGSEVLTCLPDSVGQLWFLEYLKISDLEKLEYLPQRLRHRSLLPILQIYNCPSLQL